MNFTNKIYKKFAGTVLLGSLCLMGVVSQSCTEEIDQANRYTFTGETIVDYLENRSDSFSDFLTILKRAKISNKKAMLDGDDSKGSVRHLLATYGRFTCMAPTNDAVRRHVREQFEIWYNDSIAAKNGDITEDERRITGITSPEFDELSDSMCSAIAKDHIIEGDIYHTYDLGDGALGRPNMNDRFISSRFVPDERTGVVRLKLNDASLCISADNDAENGVVHVIDKVLNPSNELAPDLLKSYEEYFSIFTDLIYETGLEKILRQTSYDMEATGIKYGEKEKRLFAPSSSWNGIAKIPETHYIKFTILAVPDVILDSLYGVKTMEDLLPIAEKWYSSSKYVKDETPITSPDHPLYRLVAYHIVERELRYDGGFVQNDIKFPSPSNFDSEKKYAKGFDRTEYYETLLDNGKMFKVTKLYSASNINDGREDLSQTKAIMLNYGQDKGAKCVNTDLIDHINARVLDVDGFRKLIHAPDTFEFRQDGLNAILHPIDRLMIYNADEMKGNILNERIRMNFMSFFPELTNNRIRWSYATEINSWEYYLIPDGYCKRVRFNADGSKMYYLYSHDGGTAGWCDYQGDEIITSGSYDFEYRIPHVPAGTYELRLGTCLFRLRGIAQTYMDGKVAGLPIDLREEYDAAKGQTDETFFSKLVAERYDFKLDSDLNNDPELIAADDKARRARGYMKGPASALVNGGTQNLREAHNAARIILGTFNLGDGDHWIRFKNTIESTSSEFMHNYLELVPKSIISDPSNPEDIY